MSAPHNPSLVLVGILPPPFHGQAVATQCLFEADLAPWEAVRIPMNASRNLSEVGRPSLRKFLGLVPLVGRILRARSQLGPAALYYTPGSGAWVPFIRDLILLDVAGRFSAGPSCTTTRAMWWIFWNDPHCTAIWADGFTVKEPGQSSWGRAVRCRSIPEAGRSSYPTESKNPKNFPPAESGDRFRVLFLGNLFEEKGVLEAIEAVRLLHSRRPSIPLELKLVGAWPEGNDRARVEAALQTLPTTIHWSPPAPAFGADKWQALRSSDVLVFPSRYRRENQPLVILEAMAAGLPVIGTRWRGIPSLVSDGESGFLVPVSNPEAISKKLELLADDPELCHRLGTRALALFDTKFTAVRFIDRMRRVFEEAAE